MRGGRTPWEGKRGVPEHAREKHREGPSGWPLDAPKGQFHPRLPSKGAANRRRNALPAPDLGRPLEPLQWGVVRGFGGVVKSHPPGRSSIVEVTLYTRNGCHLCDDAHELLLAQGLNPRLVDIDADPALREKFNVCVPVVEIDGKVRFRGRVEPVLLRRLLAGQTRDA
jgi:glutaredoxin